MGYKNLTDKEYHRIWFQKNKDRLRVKHLEYKNKRRTKIKQMAVDFMGGKCSKCGYNKSIKALEFHHHTGKKEFNISDGKKYKSWEQIKKELEKCIILCSNCHREVSWLK